LTEIDHYLKDYCVRSGQFSPELTRGKYFEQQPSPRSGERNMDFPKIREDVFYYLSVKASKMRISGEG